MSNQKQPHVPEAAHVSPASHTTHEPPVSVRTYWIVFAALMVLLIATVLANNIEHGVIGLLTALAIATVKAVLIILFFMHVKYSSRLIWLFSGASFLWFGIMLLFVFADFLTRPIFDPLGK